MSALPSKAKVVGIGAGIVGNSVVYHLAKLGWKDIVQVDKGPLPNPGGSTGHASNFIFPVDHSKEISELTLDSMRQYKEFGVFVESGGIEVARTPERMQEFHRRLQSARAFGIDHSSLLTPEEIKAIVPYIDETIILGGFQTTSAGVVDSLRMGTLMREDAIEKGALTVSANTEVLDIVVEDDRIKSVVTDNGEIECDYVVIATGCWGPKLAAMAGTSIPLTPAVHQMKDIGPVPMFLDAKSDIEYPVVRDMDSNMYERQHGTGLEIGSYAHRPILYKVEDIPSNAEAALSPTEFPFTQEDFDLQDEHALELMPEIVGDESIGQKYAINGLLSLIPDGMPILGEAPNVTGLWSASGVWIKEGPGVGRAMAEDMVLGVSEIDWHGEEYSRFQDFQFSHEYIQARCAEGFNKMYGIVHPSEQWESLRGIRVSPLYEREKALGAFFFEAGGMERPQWYEANAPLVAKFGDAVMPRTAEWESRWWSPIINAEHLQLRETCAIADLTAFVVFDVTGPKALDVVQHSVVRQMDVAVGKTIYTPVLAPNGGFKADLTVMRLGKNHFRVVTGGAHGMADKKAFASNLPADGTAHISDLTSGMATIGLWGPNARKVLESITTDDVSNEGFPFASNRNIEIGNLRVLASRISYVGELGWELYLPVETAVALWDMIWEAGTVHGLIAAGSGATAGTGRLEKSYRAYGNELETSYNMVEAGMVFPKVKDQDFVGKQAYVTHRSEEPIAILCSLFIDDHTSSSGEKRYPLGWEPIVTRDGELLIDSKGRRSFANSAGSAPSLGKHLIMSYLPPEYAKVGQELAIEYMGDRLPCTVALVGSKPLFDPENERVRS
jgi:glycine cleavage system aminomethyltransferase T/glycine/D-amino acid oxidase-like deaminating enzyme